MIPFWLFVLPIDIWFQLRIADLGKKNCDDWVVS